MMEDPETKMDIETPYEKLKDNKKKQGKDNEAKMILYNALLRKEYELVFMCKTTKDVWHTLIITHQGNLQVKDCKEQTSDDNDSKKGSDEDVHEDKVEAFNLMAINLHLEEVAEMVLEIKVVEAQDKTASAIIARKKVTSLVSVQSPRKTRLLSEELGVIAKTAMNRKRLQHVSWQSTLKSKVNELELEVKNLAKSKEVIESCQKCEVLIYEVDSLKINFSNLQDEALNCSKFKKNNVVLDDMLSR
ncbi:hypothetical protein Tco_1416854 [Tanacetum coccineum]